MLIVLDGQVGVAGRHRSLGQEFQGGEIRLPFLRAKIGGADDLAGALGEFVVVPGAVIVAGFLTGAGDLRKDAGPHGRQAARGKAQVFAAALPTGGIVDQGQTKLLGVGMIETGGNLIGRAGRLIVFGLRHILIQEALEAPGIGIVGLVRQLVFNGRDGLHAPAGQGKLGQTGSAS